MNIDALVVLLRHARLYAGHPRLSLLAARRGWPGLLFSSRTCLTPVPAMTWRVRCSLTKVSVGRNAASDNPDTLCPFRDQIEKISLNFRFTCAVTLVI